MSVEIVYYRCLERQNIGQSPEERRGKWVKIEEAYAGRPYHNLEHIQVVLDRIVLFNHLEKDFDALLLAAIYHDVVYVPGADFNELGSAAYAAVDLGQRGLDSGLTTEIMRLIHATEHVNYDDGLDTAASLICDADLYELSTDRYTENSQKIRKEFDCTDLEWRMGRLKWLRDFTLRPHIYHFGDRNHTRGELDALAQANMLAELKRLERS